jgi:hypothetical protein
MSVLQMIWGTTRLIWVSIEPSFHIAEVNEYIEAHPTITQSYHKHPVLPSASILRPQKLHDMTTSRTYQMVRFRTPRNRTRLLAAGAFHQ